MLVVIMQTVCNTKRMKLHIAIVAALCITFPLLISPSAATHIQNSPNPDHEQAMIEHHKSLPRKLGLKLSDTATTATKTNIGAHGFTSHNNKHSEAISGTKSNEETVEKGIGRDEGKKEEWRERETLTQYFTMDYSHVRKRRPIHNKSMPVGP